MAVAAALALSGCAGWLQRPFAGLRAPREPSSALAAGTPSTAAHGLARCQGGPFPAYVDRHHGAVRIGPVIFADLAYPYPPGRFKPGAPPLTVSTIVPAHTSVVIGVPPQVRSVVGLDSKASPAATPAAAHAAVSCQTGPSERIFNLTFAVSGARCAPIAVTVPGFPTTITATRRVGFGVRRCAP